MAYMGIMEKKMEATTICRVILKDWSPRILAQAGTGESNVHTTLYAVSCLFPRPNQQLLQFHVDIVQFFRTGGPDGQRGTDLHPRAAKQRKKREWLRL